MINKSIKIQTFLACFCYFILSYAVFLPVFSSTNPLIFLITCFFEGLITVYIGAILFGKNFTRSPKSKIILGCFVPITLLSAVFLSLLFLTEVIKDVCFISARNVKLTEYILLASAILILSFYLSTNGEKGIFRFCIVSAFICVIIFLMLLLPAIFHGSFVLFPTDTTSHGVSTSAIRGAIFGLYTSLDFCIFLYCFTPFIFARQVRGIKGTILFSYISSFILAFACILVCYSIFGVNLSANLKSPFYAMSKLIPGYDFTEIITVLLILAFSVKSSVYLFGCTKLLQAAFFKNDFPRKKIIISVYALIPITACTLYAFLKGNRTYGAFNHLFFPSALCWFILFILCLLFLRKKE